MLSFFRVGKEGGHMGYNDYGSGGTKTNTDFFQKAVDQAKLGYYPTNNALAARLGGLFELSEGDTAVALEPSCGEGDAFGHFLEAIKGGDRIRGYGVELDHLRSEAAKEKPFMEAVIEDDFLKGTVISNSCFSLCFSNPPYGQGDDKGDRLESMFLRQITKYLTNGGILVWIIPDACMRNPVHAKIVLQGYDVLGCYRFDEEEYAKYRQFALILKKKSSKKGVEAEEVNTFLNSYSESPFIPEEVSERIVIKKSESPKIFRAKEFKPELYAEEAKKYFGLNSLLATPEYHQTSLYAQPPHQLKDESLYMCMSCGVATGVVGSAKDKNLHLLKGRVEKVEKANAVGGTGGEGEDEKILVKVRESNQIKLTVITDQTIDETGRRVPANITVLK